MAAPCVAAGCRGRSNAGARPSRRTAALSGTGSAGILPVLAAAAPALPVRSAAHRASSGARAEPDRGEADVKYVLQWTTRSRGSGQENLATMKRSLEVLSKWTPSATMLQFVSRVDGRGGFAVAETDDPTALARDCAISSPFLDFELYPVLDIQEGAATLQAAVDYNESR